MQNKKFSGATVLLWLIIFGLQAHAGLFDDRYPSAKVIGMGGSGVAVANDVWASYYNPAGLSQINSIQLGTSYTRLFNLSFFKNYFGAAVYPLPQKYGAVSFSVQYFGVDYQNQTLSSEYTFALSHGFYLIHDLQSSLAIGYSIKAYYWNLGTSVEGLNLGSSTTLGIDVGLQASIWGRTYAGVYFLNLNAPQVGEETRHDLPQRVVIGVGYHPYDGVTTSLDLNRVVGVGETEVWGGAEFQVFKMLYLRFGGTTNPNRFTVGVGIEYQGFQLDYGMRTHSELGETHQVGVIYNF